MPRSAAASTRSSLVSVARVSTRTSTSRSSAFEHGASSLPVLSLPSRSVILSLTWPLFDLAHLDLVSQTYIHAKGMVVDDRIAIIGSANINERSQRGDRDSELACIIRDTDMIDSTMGGKPYKVGRFAHTMRVRLMREHLGIDVDELEAAEGRAELESREPEKMQEKKDEWDPDQEQSHGTDRGAHAGKTFRYVESAVGTTVSYAGDAIKGVSEAATRGLQIGGEKVASGLKVSFDDAENAPPDTDKETNADRIVQGQAEGKGFASTVVPTLEEKVMSEHRPPPDATEEGGVRKLRQAAEREREEGPTTSPPAEAREPEEQHHLSERISRPPKEGDGPKTTSQDADSKSSSGVKSFDDKEKEAATRRLGDKVTQSSDLDDTRKIPMQKREERIIDPGKDAPPLSPIDEDGGRPTDLEGNDQSDERMHKEKEAGTKIEIADPDVDSAPPDISNAGKHQQQNRHRSRSTSTAASSSASTKVDSNKAHGNEQAVNRNEITGKLRRNLRERGAYSIPLAAPKIDPYGFSDPLVDSFYKDVWLAASVRNTQIYRKVFRCMPDDLVQTWKQYREFQVRRSFRSFPLILLKANSPLFPLLSRTGRSATTRFVDSFPSSSSSRTDSFLPLAGSEGFCSRRSRSSSLRPARPLRSARRRWRRIRWRSRRSRKRRTGRDDRRGEQEAPPRRYDRSGIGGRRQRRSRR